MSSSRYQVDLYYTSKGLSKYRLNYGNIVWISLFCAGGGLKLAAT